MENLDFIHGKRKLLYGSLGCRHEKLTWRKSHKEKYSYNTQQGNHVVGMVHQISKSSYNKIHKNTKMKIKHFYLAPQLFKNPSNLTNTCTFYYASDH